MERKGVNASKHMHNTYRLLPGHCGNWERCDSLGSAGRGVRLSNHHGQDAPPLVSVGGITRNERRGAAVHPAIAGISKSRHAESRQGGRFDEDPEGGHKSAWLKLGQAIKPLTLRPSQLVQGKYAIHMQQADTAYSLHEIPLKSCVPCKQVLTVLTIDMIASPQGPGRHRGGSQRPMTLRPRYRRTAGTCL